ncbi:MAG: NAD-dependent epimerase/dehydratase family protein [Casimicrobium sp.]
MKILILGGTQFLGRHIVDVALAKRHEITLFNRGQRNTDLFPHVEKLRGDRNGDMSALKHRAFDCVIDCCGYTPEQMRRTADALGVNVPHYIFISSVSAYGKRPPLERFDETAPLASGDVGYGEEKARSEETISAVYPDRVTIIRPGLIVGPHDHTGRFVYWPQRYAIGGDVLAPGYVDKPIQWIDVRDLAEWTIRCAEQKTLGTFNAITQVDTQTMGSLLSTCATVANVASNTHWIDDVTLTNEAVAPWSELPLWIPEEEHESGGLMLARADRAIAAGLSFRSAEITVRDTLAWARTLASDDPALGKSKTLAPEREREILKKYKPI